MGPARDIILSGEELRRAGRDLPASFRIELGGGEGLDIEKILRLLPGKRLTAQARFQEQTVLAKVFFARSGFRRQIAREKRGLDLLRGAGVPAPLLLKSCSLPAVGVLLIQYLSSAENLRERWRSVCCAEAGSRAQIRVLEPLFALVGRMHRAGLCQKDLHLGNFLWHEGELKVIDGGGIARCRWPWQRSSNLGLLLAQLPEYPATFLLPLVAAYRQGGGNIKMTAERLLRLVRKQRDKQLHAYLAKTLRDSTEFCVAKNSRYFSSMVRASASWLGEIVNDPDKLMARGTPLKLGGGTTVVRLEINGHAVVVKRYNRGGFWRHLKRCWRMSRARKAWLNGYHLRALGIDTPRPLAFIEERRGLLCDRSWLVTEYVDGGNILELMARHEEDQPPAAVGNALKRLFASLRRERITHGDMKGTNLIWQDSKIWLIDLDGMKVHRKTFAWERAWLKNRTRLLRNWDKKSWEIPWLENLFSEMENHQK
jgi:tRNA A-37 threonylcarbamoyl transferase component Bud32